MTTTRIYLSGPMTGYPEFNFPAFHAAAEVLRAKGIEVHSPADIADTSMAYEYYMKLDVQMVIDSDAIVLLDGWEASPGANFELLVAILCGLDVWRYVDGEMVSAELLPDMKVIEQRL